MKGLVLTFPDGSSYNIDYIWDSLNLNENYFKNLNPVENTCKVTAVFSTAVANKLKQFADENIIANVYDNSDNLLFAGYLRKTFSFTKKQRNEPIAIEVVSPSYIMDVELSAEIFKQGEKLGNIVNLLGNQAGMTLGCTLTETVDYFRALKGDKLKDILTDILFEHGYTYDFNNQGAFVVLPLFNKPNTTNIVHGFTGADCLEQIQIKRTEKQYTGVTATWQKKEYVQETLLYEDTQGSTTTSACTIEVAPRSYMYGNDNTQGKHYLQFDCTKGEVLNALNIWPVVTGTYLDILQTSYENCGDSVLWSAFNPHMTITATYHKFQWWGRAWVATSTNENKTSVVGDKTKSITLSYLNDNVTVNALINNIADYYRYSLFNITLKSKTNIQVGAFVTVEDYGTGKITGRIISKQTKYTGVYTYTIESVSEYEPATVDTTKSTIKKNASDGNTEHIAEIKAITDSLQEQIDGIEYGGTTCALDINSICIEVDDNGYTQTVQSFTVFVSLRRSEKDIPFTIGNDDNPLYVPAGWTYVLDGNKITFTIGENVQVIADNIKIPVIYRPILSETPFVDEEGIAFVDSDGHPFVDIQYGTSGTVWNLYLSYIGNGYGKYLGTFKTIQQINACNPNISDYFTWGGTNKLPTDLTYEKYLYQARTYKYIGTGKTWSWEQDKNSGHMQAALSDVLGIANADLQNNNSDVWEYLDHLTANSIYCGMLVANEAFIEQLAAKIITADLVTTAKLESGTAYNLDNYGFALQSNVPTANNIVKEVREIYYKTTSKDLPSKPTSANQIVDTASSNVWTTYNISIGQNDYCYACTEETYYDGHVAFTDVYVHAKTIISGGYIRTGLIQADSGWFDNVEAQGFSLKLVAGDVLCTSLAYTDNTKNSFRLVIPGHGSIKVQINSGYGCSVSLWLNNQLLFYYNQTIESGELIESKPVTVTENDILTLYVEETEQSVLYPKVNIYTNIQNPLFNFLAKWSSD